MLKNSSLVLVIAAAAVLAGCGNGVQRALETDGYHALDLAVGEGDIAGPGDHLTISYSTCLYQDGARGREMDSAGDDGLGFVLGAGEVMPGWDAGLAGMAVGGVRRLLVGPEMIGRAFRPRGVAADEVLWCEIELLAVARLEVTDLTEGEGEPIASGDYVEIRYEGWHWEGGQKVDQFVGGEEDAAPVGVMLGAGMVNRGLDLGLAGMRVGGRRQLLVPPALAYGARGRDAIRPDATLLYEVSVVSRPEVASEILREGSGESVFAGQRVRIHLAGWIRQPDGSKGEKFQDSRDQGMPLVVVLGDFKIQPGLELGLRGMKPGEKKRLEVPSAMAFGPAGWHRADRTLVPPDTDVIYEVEVMEGGVQIR